MGAKNNVPSSQSIPDLFPENVFTSLLSDFGRSLDRMAQDGTFLLAQFRQKIQLEANWQQFPEEWFTLSYDAAISHAKDAIRSAYVLGLLQKTHYRIGAAARLSTLSRPGFSFLANRYDNGTPIILDLSDAELQMPYLQLVDSFVRDFQREYLIHWFHEKQGNFAQLAQEVSLSSGRITQLFLALFDYPIPSEYQILMKTPVQDFFEYLSDMTGQSIHSLAKRTDLYPQLRNIIYGSTRDIPATISASLEALWADLEGEVFDVIQAVRAKFSVDPVSTWRTERADFNKILIPLRDTYRLSLDDISQRSGISKYHIRSYFLDEARQPDMDHIKPLIALLAECELKGVPLLDDLSDDSSCEMYGPTISPLNQKAREYRYALEALSEKKFPEGWFSLLYAEAMNKCRDDVKGAYIRHVLSRANGSVTQSAILAHVDRGYIRDLANQYRDTSSSIAFSEDEFLMTYADFLAHAFDDFQSQYIARIFDANGGNITGAAAACSLDRKNFRRLLNEKLPVSWREFSGDIQDD